MAAASKSVTATNRVIALVDMDCFYVQVEERDDPSIKGVPAAVVQYKAYKGGGIIAVNYEARAKGVTRQMRGDDAKAVCPEIQLVRVPETRGKADLTKYRDAGREVINVLTEFSACVERASIDEAYIDLTEAVENRMSEISSSVSFISWQESIVTSLEQEYFSTNFVLGHESTSSWFDAMKGSEIPSMDDTKLAIGAEIVGKMRDAVYKKTGFRCSAGIAHNKIVAKLVCGINKPNKQTVLPHSSVPTLWATTKIGKVRGLGGKLGDYLVEKLGCERMSDLGKFTEKQLCAGLGTKTGQWLYQLSLGYDDEPVTPRQLPKSIGCNKNFLGPEALRTKEKTKFWISQLAAEVAERIQRDLEMNNRRAKTLTLHLRFEDQNALSRSCGVPNYNPERIAADAYGIVEKLYQTVGVLPIVSLGLIASKFEDEVDVSGYAKINNFFKPGTSKDTSTLECSTNDSREEGSNTLSTTKSSVTSSTVTSQPNSKINQKASTSKANGTLSRFLVTKDNKDKKAEPEKPPPALPTSSASAMSVEDDATESTSINPNGLLPSSGQDKEVSPRKTFFSFSSATPKPMSPGKSPRKGLSAVIVEGEGRTTSNVDPGFMLEKECDRCGKKVHIDAYDLHMDYHFAKDLSKELNGLPSAAPKESTNSTTAGSTKQTKVSQKRGRGGGGGPSTSSGSKRGRPAKSSSSTSSSQIRKIDSYFTSQS